MMNKIISTTLAEEMLSEEELLVKAASLPEWNSNMANPLLIAARPLLCLLIKLRDISRPKHIAVLRNIIINELSIFDKQARQLNCQPRLILAARYCLCTALDEIILSNSWAADSEWSQHTLLSLIHQETWGGERFFIILEKMSVHPRENITLLEVIYLLLSLGFEGKYYNKDKMVREEIMHHLYQIINRYRDHAPDDLSPSLMLTNNAILPVSQGIKFNWKLPVAAVSAILFFGLITNIAIYANTHKTLQELIDSGEISARMIYTKGVAQQTSTSYRLRHKHHLHRNTIK